MWVLNNVLDKEEDDEENIQHIKTYNLKKENRGHAWGQILYLCAYKKIP